MEAVKPLVVLVLFGTILYGAYSVVQKGPSGPADTGTAATEAPPFAPPQIDLPTTPAASPAAAPPLAASALGAGPQTTPFSSPATAQPATSPDLAQPASSQPLPLVDPAVPIAAGAVAAGAGAAAALAASDGATYLPAQSAPPPVAGQVATLAEPPRSDRYASLAEPAALPTDIGPSATATPLAAAPVANAFATAWGDAHEKLTAGRYAEALAALSVWYDDPSLSLEESQRLEDLLGQLAGTVVYSREHLLLPPYVVQAGETLPSVAAPLGVSWQLLGKINGVPGPDQLIVGEHLKVIRGPFDAVVSVSRRRLSLQLGGNYAGSFPVVVGRQLLTRVGGSLGVVDVRRSDAAAVTTVGQPVSRRGIVLDDGMLLEAADDPGIVADAAPPTSLVVSTRDLDELLDMLGPGSRVLIRQ